MPPLEPQRTCRALFAFCELTEGPVADYAPTGLLADVPVLDTVGDE
jgi:hypothetical protein